MKSSKILPIFYSTLQCCNLVSSSKPMPLANSPTESTGSQGKLLVLTLTLKLRNFQNLKRMKMRTTMKMKTTRMTTRMRTTGKMMMTTRMMTRTNFEFGF